MAAKLLRALIPKQHHPKFRWLKVWVERTALLWAQTLLRIAVPDRWILFVKNNRDIIKKLDYDRHDIYLKIDSFLEYDTRIRSCSKEPDMIEWIHTFIKEDSVVYDIGANVGVYSLVIAKHCNDNARIYAFEPGYMNYVKLCQNVALNNSQDNIIPLQLALTDATSIDTLNYSSLLPGASLHVVGEPIDFKGAPFNPVYKQTLLTFRLDDLIEQFDIPSPNFIKIDVDGNELKILQGARRTLNKPDLKSIIVEMEEGGDQADQITKLLEANQLILRSKNRSPWIDDTSPFANTYNYIFLRDNITCNQDVASVSRVESKLSP